MKRRAFLSALLALPVAPLAIKGMAQETLAPAPEPDFPEGYRTFVNVPNRIYFVKGDGTVKWSYAGDTNTWVDVAEAHA